MPRTGATLAPGRGRSTERGRERLLPVVVAHRRERPRLRRRLRQERPLLRAPGAPPEPRAGLVPACRRRGPLPPGRHLERVSPLRRRIDTDDDRRCRPCRLPPEGQPGDRAPDVAARLDRSDRRDTGTGRLALTTMDRTPGAPNAAYLVEASTGKVLAKLGVGNSPEFAQPVFAG